VQKNFFEKHPKIILLIVNLFFLGILYFILSLNIFQDVKDGEKYSVIDRAIYQLRCEGKRHIRMRENAPNQVSYRIPPFAPQEKYVFRTDENGFVEPSKIYENPDLNIFFFGGSTTECETVFELYRFPYLAGRILEEKTGKKINSYNAGKSGNNSLHSINNLINKAAPLHPDIIVRMDNVNDLSTLLYEATYWNRNKGRSNLACFSKNYDLLRNFSNEWDESPFVSLVTDPAHQARVKQEHYKILKLFVAVVRGVGAKPILMTQANRIESDPNFSTGRGDAEFNRAYRKLYLEFHDVTRQVAKEENIMLIDLAKMVPPKEELIYDSVHLSNEGSKIVAGIVAKNLEKTVKEFNNK
jgi:lysophospholipase L1-like esterase